MSKMVNMEWMGTKIIVHNTFTRVELKVDGKTQDFYEGVVLPKQGLKLSGRSDSNALVVAEIKWGIAATRIRITYDGKEILKKGW